MNNIWTDTKKFKKLADRARLIYDKVKDQFEPKENGKFLAIEPDSGDVYMNKDEVEAIMLAKKDHPSKLVYLMRIGYEAVDTLATPFFSNS